MPPFVLWLTGFLVGVLASALMLAGVIGWLVRSIERGGE